MADMQLTFELYRKVQKCMKNMKIYYLDCVYSKTSTSTENKNKQANRRLMDKILQTENLTDVAR